MRRMIDPKEALPSTITFDKDGNRTVSKNLTVNENFSVNSFKNSQNIDGSPDNRYSHFNEEVYVPYSDVNTSSYAWHWITRKLDQDITGYSGFIEMHNWYELYNGSKKHNGYITCDFYIEWKSSKAYSGVSSIELPVGFNGWLLQPYKGWKGWAYSLDYFGGIVKMTTGGKEYPVSISVKDHTLEFTATGESITIPANTPIRFEGRFFQRRA